MNAPKILIVDDDVMFLKVVSTKLKASGFLVLTAEDGSSALGLMREFQPDLILLDISFPPDVAHGGGVAWDGIQLMNWIRQTLNAKVPIVIITAIENIEVRTKAMAAGAAAFLQKPVGGELIEVIRRILSSDF